MFFSNLTTLENQHTQYRDTFVDAQSKLIREPRLLTPVVQPLGSVKIDWSNSLTYKLIDFVIARPPYLISLRSGTFAKSQGGVESTRYANRAGYGNRTNAISVTNGCSIQVPIKLRPELAFGAKGYTVVAHLSKPSAINGDSSGRPFLRLAVTDPTYGEGYLEVTDTGSNIGAYIAGISGGNRGISSGLQTISYNKPYTAAVWTDISSGLLKGQSNEGSVVSTPDGTTSLRTIAPTSITFIQGVSSWTSAPGDQVLFAGGVWARQLTDQERYALFRNSYEFIVPA